MGGRRHEPAARAGRSRERGTQAPGPLAGAPAFSHDGKTIVYTATNHAADGRLGGYIYDTQDMGSKADLVRVPYNDRAGGAITPIPGASDPVWQEYYPAFSPQTTRSSRSIAPAQIRTCTTSRSRRSS